MKYNFTKNKFKNNENIYNFDNRKYNFSELVKINLNDYFGTDFNLNEFNKLISNEYMKKEELDYFKKMPVFGKTDRCSIFIQIYHKYFDNSDEFSNLYNKFIVEFIKPKFFPNEEYIIVQKTPNLRVHIPNTSNLGKRETDPNDKIIGVHYDAQFDHSNEEINLIIPLTEMFETNSIYHEYEINSNENYEDYNNLQLEVNQIAFLYLNKWKHYNKINVTNKTRVSFDTRIIPYSKYTESNLESITSKVKFSLGNYYIKL